MQAPSQGNGGRIQLNMSIFIVRIQLNMSIFIVRAMVRIMVRVRAGGYRVSESGLRSGYRSSVALPVGLGFWAKSNDRWIRCILEPQVHDGRLGLRSEAGLELENSLLYWSQFD